MEFVGSGHRYVLEPRAHEHSCALSPSTCTTDECGYLDRLLAAEREAAERGLLLTVAEADQHIRQREICRATQTEERSQGAEKA